MAIEPTLESVLGAKRGDLLNKIGNSAQSAQQAGKREATERIAQRARDRDEQQRDEQQKDDLPVDPKRGRTVNFKA